MENSEEDIRHLEEIKDTYVKITDQLGDKILEHGEFKAKTIIIESEKKKLEQLQNMALETLRTAKLRFNALERR